MGSTGRSIEILLKMKNLRQSYYDSFSKFYDRFVSLHSRAPQGALKKFLAELASMKDGDRVLDICCGTGSLLLELSKRTGSKGLAVGLDFSRGMLMVSKGKTGMRSNICLVQADAAALPFSSRSFDAVTCTHAFYELKGAAQERALQGIVRILKPGKAFFMLEHDLPENPFIRTLYYLRLASMGAKRAIAILRHERNILERYFKTVERISAPTGRSKILLCHN
ncbi:MAG: class I SAM-dependent methyltransferase [Syntrophobacteraceae bacterium]